MATRIQSQILKAFFELHMRVSAFFTEMNSRMKRVRKGPL